LFTLSDARIELARLRPVLDELVVVRADAAELAVALTAGGAPTRLGGLPEWKAAEARLDELMSTVRRFSCAGWRANRSLPGITARTSGSPAGGGCPDDLRAPCLLPDTRGRVQPSSVGPPWPERPDNRFRYHVVVLVAPVRPGFQGHLPDNDSRQSRTTTRLRPFSFALYRHSSARASKVSSPVSAGRR
jgi:hypothetical protein